MPLRIPLGENTKTELYWARVLIARCCETGIRKHNGMMRYAGAGYSNLAVLSPELRAVNALPPKNASNTLFRS